MSARVLLFHLDELRRRFGARLPAGADPRADTSPFRAFRDRLLAEAAQAARARASLSMWWEGSYNGYCLAVAAKPAEALGDLDPERVCAAEDERLERDDVGGPPHASVGRSARERYPLGEVAPGRAEVARDPDGTSYEAPFGAAAGHFGAPGMRRVT
ncbi:MAG TPA: hypothetical protein VFR85_03475 [Anaeromyxobacteraceae bacterium]|nr:hypothetical protein [Anaeromyxobacteraceae bacterium]